MTDATVAINRLQTLEIAGNIAPEIALNDPLVIGDDMENLIELLLSEIRSAHVGIKTSSGDDEIGPGGANAIDIPEGVSDLLFGGNFYAEETRHV